MKVLHRDSWTPWVIKSVQTLDAKHEYNGAVEDQEEDDDCDEAHQRDGGQVPLAIKCRAKHWIVLMVHRYSSKCLDLQKDGINPINYSMKSNGMLHNTHLHSFKMIFHHRIVTIF